MVFTTVRFSKVAIESWPECDLNSHDPSIPFRHSNRLSYQANSLSEPNLYSYSNFISLSIVHISFRSLPSSVATFVLSKVSHR